MSNPTSLTDIIGPRRRRWTPWILGFGAVFVLGCAGVMGLALSLRSTPVVYETSPVTRGDLVVTVSATGTVGALGEVTVGAEVSGKLTEVLADYNDVVKAGDVLARIDPEQTQAQLDQAIAQVLSAEASLEQAKATEVETGLALKRAKAGAAKGLVSDSDVEAAEAAAARATASRKTSAANLAINRASRTSSENSLKKTTIVAPIDGMVLARYVEAGQTVTAGFSTPELYKLAHDLTKMRLIVDVDEADVGQVKAHQDATFTVDAFPGKSFPSVVDKLYVEPTTTSNVVTYEAVLSVDNSELLLLPGMTATADIIVDRRVGVLTVPEEALRYAPANATVTEGDMVWVNEGGILRSIPVVVGTSDGTRTEVSGAGLSDGLVVITGEEAGG